MSQYFGTCVDLCCVALFLPAKVKYHLRLGMPVFSHSFLIASRSTLQPGKDMAWNLTPQYWLLVFSYKTCSASSNIYMPDLYSSVLHNLKLIEVTHSLSSTVTGRLMQCHQKCFATWPPALCCLPFGPRKYHRRSGFQ